jgi:hypothetical protein
MMTVLQTGVQLLGLKMPFSVAGELDSLSSGVYRTNST